MPCNVSVRGAFQLTPSVGRATDGPGEAPLLRGISIHALREEGDLTGLGAALIAVVISIHALREEGDVRWALLRPKASKISIHALREEGNANKGE